MNRDDITDTIRREAEGIEEMASRICDAIDRNQVVLDTWDLPRKAERLAKAAWALLREIES